MKNLLFVIFILVSMMIKTMNVSALDNSLEYSFGNGISINNLTYFLKNDTYGKSLKESNQKAEINFKFGDNIGGIELYLNSPIDEIEKTIKNKLDFTIKDIATSIKLSNEKSNLPKDIIQGYQEHNVLITKIKLLEDIKNVDNKTLGLNFNKSVSSGWIPYHGTSLVNQNKTTQTFWFDNVNSFGSNSTYEHETQVYNKNYADYSGTWATNLPNGYKDTPFSDSIDNFTVGSSNAYQIITGKEYYTYMTLTPGSQNTAQIRIKGQRGHRTPSYCYSTWCIFADATSGTLTSGINGIGGVSWVR